MPVGLWDAERVPSAAANPSGWGRDLAHTTQGNRRLVRRLLTYGASGTGVVFIITSGYPEWVGCFVVGVILLTLGLTESKVVAR